jgi:hypothetical protein
VPVFDAVGDGVGAMNRRLVSVRSKTESLRIARPPCHHRRSIRL